jgi:hypothetical protein
MKLNAQIWIGIHKSGPMLQRSLAAVQEGLSPQHIPFRDQLGWQFGGQEGDSPDRLT